MKSKKNIIFVIYLFLNCIFFVKGINVLSKNVYNKNINSMGVDISYALYDIELDQDLYYYSSVICPLSTHFKVLNFDTTTSNCFCDLTNSNTAINPCSTLNCTIKENQEFFSSQWEVLEFDTGISKNLTIKEKTQLRFTNINENIGFSLKVTPIDGSFKILLSTPQPSETSREFKFESLKDEIFISFCPSQTSFDLGTYIINIVPLTFESTFLIDLNHMSIPVVQENVTYKQECNNVIPTHECLSLGLKNDSLDLSVSKLLFLEINDPGFYTIDFRSYDESTLYISDDENIKIPNQDNSKWMLSNVGDSNLFNTLTIYFEESKILYLKLECPNENCITVTGYTPEIFFAKSQTIHTKKISDMNILEGSLALASTSRIKFNNKYYSCSDFVVCNPFQIVFPTQQVNPLWPIPNALQFIQDFDYRYMETKNSQFKIKEKSYQFAIILSINYGKGIIEYFNLNDSLNIEIEFLNTLFDFDDNPIKLSINNFNFKSIENCNIENFNSILKEINDGIDIGTQTSIEKLNNWKYNVALLKFSNDWIGCENYALSFLNLETIVNNLTSYQCPYSISDPNYQLDPCCNYHLSFSKACKEKVVNFETLAIQDYQSDKLSEECFNSDCTSIVLNQFASQKFLLRENDDCKLSNNDAINTHLLSYNALRECKSQILDDIPSCSSNDDCLQFSKGNKGCDLFRRQCIIDYQVLDKNYIECVLNKLPLGTLYSLISTLAVNSTIVNSIYEKSKFKDWVIEGSDSKHSTYIYALGTFNQQNVQSEKSLTFNLIDYSNEIQYKSVSQFKGWNFIKDDYSDDLVNLEKLNCDAYFDMISVNLSPEVYDAYSYRCDKNHPTISTIHDFCGVCGNDSSSYCYVYDGSLSHYGSTYLDYDSLYPFSQSDATIDQDACEGSISMCLLKDGSYVPNTNQADCENNHGICSVPCGYECTGISSTCLYVLINVDQKNPIYANAIMDQQTCEDEGFTYDINEEICDTGIKDEQNCLDSGYTWLDCPSNTIDNCIGPTWNYTDYDDSEDFNFYRRMCNLKEIKCQTKQDCESKGKCSDYQYFYDQVQLDDKYPYPNGLGKCTKPHSIDTQYGKNCDPWAQYDSPSGCYTIESIPGKKVCEMQNGTWWKASTTKDECESQMGCKILDFIYQNTMENINPYNLPYASRFNEMDQENCLLEQNHNAGYQWTNKFKWTDGVWYPGVYMKPQWYHNKRFEGKYQYKETLNYQDFYNQVIDATKKQVSILYSSEAYCQKEKSENFLNSVLCSCSSEGSSDCFNSTNRILAQTITCNGDMDKSLSFLNGEIIFTNNSIPYGCEMISVSLVSKSEYSTSSPQPLSNNFVSYIKPDNFAVLNKNGAIIGTLLNDGIILKSEYGFNEIKLCMTINGSSIDDNSKYPIFDFAIKSKLTNSLEPMNTVAVKQEINNLSFYCSNIFNLTTNEILYPMNRISGDWENQEKKYLDTKTTVLVYILACLFVLVGGYGLLQTIEFLIIRFKSNIPLQLTHLLIFSVTSFILIRGIYFFVLPSGSLTDLPASDYVLVVLPTFIYLSSFSIIIALWYIIVFMVLKFNPDAGNMTKRLAAIVATINTTIYLFFIAIVIVFQYTPFEPNKDCLSLIFEEMKNSDQQIAVSIAYSVVQAFLSLLIGILFIYLGTSIIGAMKKNNLGGIYSNNQSKIKILTIICSIAFILHCLFIILISVKAVSSIIFVFIGLIITEILPAISILLVFDNRFIKISSSTSSSTSGSSRTDKSNKGIHLNTITTETGTESSEYIIKKN